MEAKDILKLQDMHRLSFWQQVIGQQTGPSWATCNIMGAHLKQKQLSQRSSSRCGP